MDQQSWKRGLGIDVLTAARERVAWAFDTFSRIYISGPSGKDSGAMMHVVCQEARRCGRKVGALYIDLEAQYKLTEESVREMFVLYADVIEPHWVALPIRLRNAVSMTEPYWCAWDPEREGDWVRRPPPEAITDPDRYPFYRTPGPASDGAERYAQEFEEFVAEFGAWYAQGQTCACFVGIRAGESLNRWRSIVREKNSLDGRGWTSWKVGGLYNAYPIYDWRTEDVWTFFGRTGLPYNRLYDRMHQAGVPISQQRICQPYGDDQRRGLWLYHVVEPETWGRVVARVAGAGAGALYAGKRGNVLGNGKVDLPHGHTWESYARFLLASLPEAEAEHYRVKIRWFLHWWEKNGFARGVPDEADPALEAAKKAPSWRRICKVILKNDRLCKGLTFSQTAPESYAKYRKIQEARKARWGHMGI